MRLVGDAVEAGHQHRGEREVGVGGRIREADLDALRLRAGHMRDAARGRAVARGVGEQHGRFVARHETLVAVRGRVGESVQRLRVLEDAADVEQACLREVGVFVAGEDGLAFFPDRLVPQLPFVCMPEPLSPKIGFGMKQAGKEPPLMRARWQRIRQRDNVPQV